MHRIRINLRKLFLAVVLLVGSATASFAQTLSLSWQKTHGSVNPEFGSASIKLNNNLYVHGGYIMLPNNVQGPYLVFTNTSGDTISTQKYLSILDGRITGMVANEDGSFVACGTYTAVSPNIGALFLVKFNQLGTILWQKKFNQGRIGPRQQVIRVPDGYLLIADTQIDIIKTDLAGNLVWQKTYGQISGAQHITPLTDGSYFISGLTHKGSPTTVSAFHRINYWFLKMKPNGDTIFSKVIGNKTNFEICYAAAPTADGGIAVAGAYVANVTQNKRQGQILKLDSLFNLQWDMKVMPKSGDYEIGCEFFNIQSTVTGDFIASGTNTDSIGPNGSLVYINSLGVKQWEQQYIRNSIAEKFYSMLYEDDGTVLLTGTKGGYYSGSNLIFDHYLVKLQGLPLPYKPDFCAKPPVSSYSYLVKPDSVVITNAHKSKAGTRYGVISKWEYLFGDGNSFVTYDSLVAKRVAHKYDFGTMFMYGSPVKLIVTNNTFCTDTLTLYPFGGAPTGITGATAANVEVKLYPNPMQQESVLELKNYSGKEKLSLEVTDMLGRKVAMPSKQLKANQWQLQRGGLSKGIYVYRLISSNKLVAQGKIVLTN